MLKQICGPHFSVEIVGADTVASSIQETVLWTRSEMQNFIELIPYGPLSTMGFN